MYEMAVEEIQCGEDTDEQVKPHRLFARKSTTD